MQNPRFVEWANREDIDLSKNIEINYRQNRISAVVGSTRHTFSSANIGPVWTSIMDPIMSAAKALRSNAPYVHSPSHTTIAPAHLIADFYGEDSFTYLGDMKARGRELVGNKTFGPVVLSNRSDGEIRQIRPPHLTRYGLKPTVRWPWGMGTCRFKQTGCPFMTAG